jgi:hypothetical protein
MATLAELAAPTLHGTTPQLLRRLSGACWEHCNQIVDWQRDHLLKADKPSPEAAKRYRQELAWLIRVVQHLLALASDPEFPDPSVQDEFQALLGRLNYCWRIAQESGISEQEADLILRECFPNGPGA